MNRIFEKDLYRYYGNKGENKLKKIFRPLEIKYIYYLRKCQCTENKLIKIYYKLKLRKIYKRRLYKYILKQKLAMAFI